MAKQNKNAPQSTLSERDAMDYLPAPTQLVYWEKKKKSNIQWSWEYGMAVCSQTKIVAALREMNLAPYARSDLTGPFWDLI